MTLDSILCAVDFSSESRGALRYAAALAQRFGGRLSVVFVNDPLLRAAGRNVYGSDRAFTERTRNELARFVQTTLRTSYPRVAEAALTVAAGTPAEEILRAAKRLRSDVVVLGTRGLSGIRKLFFGSTAELVLRQARVPVLAVPPAAARRHGEEPLSGIARVLAPIDLAGDWQPDAVRAGLVAAMFDAELVLIHVLAEVQAPPWLRPSRARNRRRMDLAKRALERVRTKVFVDLRATTTVVIAGDPADEIARLAADQPALVVMSLRGTGGVFGARRGSIAYHLLTHAATPVLALPRRRIGGRFPVRAAKAIGDILSERDRVEIAGIDALLSAASKR